MTATHFALVTLAVLAWLVWCLWLFRCVLALAIEVETVLQKYPRWRW